MLRFLKLTSLVLLKNHKIIAMLDQKEKVKLNTVPQNPKEDSFDSWLDDLEGKEQPETCTIDDPDCEACGS